MTGTMQDVKKRLRRVMWGERLSSPMEEILTLLPGEFLLVVRNCDAFELRYGAGIAARIAGPYEGKLANEGESVKRVEAMKAEWTAWARSVGLDVS